MKTPGRIRHQFNQIVFRHKKAAIQESLKRTPQNCVWNTIEEKVSAHSNRLPVLTFRVCQGSELKGRVCDAEFGGVEVAKGCPFFQPQDPLEIKDFFKSLKKAEPKDLAQMGYADLAALAWVMGEGDPGDADQGEEDTDEPNQTDPTSPQKDQPGGSQSEPVQSESKLSGTEQALAVSVEKGTLPAPKRGGWFRFWSWVRSYLRVPLGGRS